MNPTASVVHRLGLATAFGGMVFGKLGLDPAVDVIEERRERGRVVTRAWMRWSVLGGAGLLAAAATWWLERSRPQLVPDDDDVRALDVLLAVASITGCMNLISGLALARSSPRGSVPLQTGMRPSREMTRPQRALHWTMILGGWTQPTD